MQSIPFCELTPRTGQIQYYCITPQHFSQPGTAYFRFFWQFAFLMQKQHPQTAYCKYALRAKTNGVDAVKSKTGDMDSFPVAGFAAI